MVYLVDEGLIIWHESRIMTEVTRADAEAIGWLPMNRNSRRFCWQDSDSLSTQRVLQVYNQTRLSLYGIADYLGIAECKITGNLRLYDMRGEGRKEAFALAVSVRLENPTIDNVEESMIVELRRQMFDGWISQNHRTDDKIEICIFNFSENVEILSTSVVGPTI